MRLKGKGRQSRDPPFYEQFLHFPGSNTGDQDRADVQNQVIVVGKDEDQQEKERKGNNNGCRSHQEGTAAHDNGYCSYRIPAVT